MKLTLKLQEGNNINEQKQDNTFVSKPVLVYPIKYLTTELRPKLKDPKSYWKNSYNDLSQNLKNAVNEKFKLLNVQEDYEKAYNSGKYNAALLAIFKYFPIQGRIKENDSPTKAESSNMEEIMNKTAYNAFGRVQPNMKYAIPYIYEKEIKVPKVGRVSSNVLDSLAKYATITKLPLYEALGLASHETKLGAIINDNFQKGKSEFNRILGNSSYFRNYGIIPAESLVRDFRYNIKEDPIDRNIPPLLHAFNYYLSGKYNSKDPSHTEKVRTVGMEVFESPVVLQWYKEYKDRNEK